MKFMKNEEGVSPVIGVILMVAITVILAAVIAVFVFGLAGDLEGSAQKDVRITTGTDDAGDITYTVFSGNDVGAVTYLNWTNGSGTGSVGGPLVIGTKGTTGLPKAGDGVIFTAIFNDGSSQVIAQAP